MTDPHTSAEPELLDRPVAASMAQLAIPMFVALSLLASVGIIDAYFVGRLGSDALAAFGFAFPLALLIRSALFGVGAGLTSNIARAIGSHDPARAAAFIRVGMPAAVGVGACITLFAYLCREAIFRALGADAAVLEQASAYFALLLLALFAGSVVTAGSAVLRGLGETTSSAGLLLVTAGLNALLDPALILGIGAWPGLGIQGAALATLCGNVAAALATVLLLRKRLAELGAPAPAPVGALLAEIRAVALPAFSAQMLGPLSIAIITMLVARFGTSAVAAQAIVGRLEFQLLMMPLAIGMALEPLIGQSWGARDRARAGQALVLGCKMAAAWGLLCWLVLGSCGALIARGFSEDPEVVRVTAQIFMVLPAAYAAGGMTLAITFALNAVGQAMRATSISLTYTFVLLPICAYGSSLFYEFSGVFAGVVAASWLEFGLACFLARKLTAGLPSLTPSLRTTPDQA
jgi:putative MATE family efflux protein